MGGREELAGFTCHAPLQHSLHKNILTACAEGEKDKRRRWKKGEDTQRYARGRGSDWKNRQPWSIFSEPRARRAGGGGKKTVSYIFLDVWSEPKGPPLQGHNAIKHSEMKCLIGGDKGGRGGREGSNGGCGQASRMKAGVEPWWGWGRWLGWGQEMRKGYSGCREPELAKSKRLQPNDERHHTVYEWLQRRHAPLGIRDQQILEM